MRTKSITSAAFLLFTVSVASACPFGGNEIRSADAANEATERGFVPNDRAANGVTDTTPDGPLLLAGNTACNPRVKVCEE